MIYDISQEILNCQVYPGDPVPEKKTLCSMEHGDLYNLSSFSMCAHNGTHVDAPSHFIKDGKTIDQMPLESFIGLACVMEHQGEISAEDAENMLNKADGIQRLLIKGDAVVTLQAAEIFAQSNLLLLGNQSQSVGPIDAPMAVHCTLLKKEIILLEGIVLDAVPEGTYWLNAAPLNIKAVEGSPCRAVLITLP